MAFTIQQLAKALGAQAFGALDLEVDGAAEPSLATNRDLALAMSPKYANAIGAGRARAAMIAPGMDWTLLGIEAAIVAPRPRYAMAGLTAALDPGPQIAPGIHPTVIVDPTAAIGANAAIGPFVVIGRGVVIGPRARIASHVSIAEGAVIGGDVLIHSGVRVGARAVLGARVILQPNVIIGGDGFSFVTPEKSQVEAARESLGTAQPPVDAQSWTRIHSLGAVEIGDDVEVGAGSAIDRGTVANTVIGARSKLDNLVHIGHNVQVGQDCLLCGQVGIAGSARVGDRVVMAGQCGVSDNIVIGDDVVCGGATKIFSNVPKGRIMMGSPAVKMDAHLEMYKSLRRLPRLLKTVAALQKAVSKSDQND
ncbi:MAG: UDP-3-O-[3-hydroxymyristoyl] glucosamine N-acyltransferase [Paracoccaceae bacterium]|jgi:UDP-3-O-[3-hydroxymyristoyl] glucosamine N-acyltransferase